MHSLGALVVWRGQEDVLLFSEVGLMQEFEPNFPGCKYCSYHRGQSFSGFENQSLLNGFPTVALLS